MHPRNRTQIPSSSVRGLASAVQEHQRGAAKRNHFVSPKKPNSYKTRVVRPLSGQPSPVRALCSACDFASWFVVQCSQSCQVERSGDRVEHPALNLKRCCAKADVADSVLRLVSEYNIDLLVVPTRGYRHLKRLLLGSAAEKLVRQAFCPVLVVPLQARLSSDQALGIRRIVCPTGFSPASSAALAFAIPWPEIMKRS